LVCQNQSIDDSDADLAKDLRAEVRKQLLGGADDKTILSNLQEKYGDYVLLNPPVSLATIGLWATPILALLLGGGLIVYSRRRGLPTPTPSVPLPSASEDKELASEKAIHTRPIGANSLAVTASFCILIAGAIYWFGLGSPSLPSQPLSQRASEINLEARQAEAQLAEKQQAFAAAKDATMGTPENIGNWLELALAAAELGRVEEELNALRTALSLTNEDIGIKSMLAETLTRSADGQVIPEARQLIAEILAENEGEPRALFLSGLAAMEDGAYNRAVDNWRYLIEISAKDAPWVGVVRENLTEAAERAGIALEEAGIDLKEDTETSPLPALSQESLSAAAEMSEAERLEMIEGMVANLRQRLDENPKDSEGWQRLARAYRVLNRPEEALEALGRASAAALNDFELQLAVLEQLMMAGKDRDTAPSQDKAKEVSVANIVLERAMALNAEHPELLFFAGHFARRDGDKDKARFYWAKLLDKIPASSETARLLQLELDYFLL
jgi:cytochrome c-type biogenesis protein CcmH